MRARDDQRGQAAVELVAVLPLAALVALCAWQAVLAGVAWWAAGGAARAAARATAVGADPLTAARRAVPGPLAGGVRVRRAADGSIEARVAVPALVGIRLGAARASVGPPGGTS